MNVFSHFDVASGWDNTNPGWHEFHINAPDVYSEDFYQEVFDWLYNSIDKCERHVRWKFTLDKVLVKFRYERDYIYCSLRW